MKWQNLQLWKPIDFIPPVSISGMDESRETFRWSNLAAWCAIIGATVKWILTVNYGSWASNLHQQVQSVDLGYHFLYNFLLSIDPSLAAISAGLVTCSLMGMMIYFNCLDVGKSTNSQLLSSPNFQKFTSQEYLRPKGLMCWLLAVTCVGTAGVMWVHLTT